MRRTISLCICAAWVILGAVSSSRAVPPPSQTGQVRQGWQIFNEKHCIACHAVWGEGERIGPDLGRTKTEFLSGGQLAGVFWNHAPDMWSRMVSKGIPVRSLTEEEMGSLFSFLYFIRFVDEPGDPLQGQTLAHQKKCDVCHATERGDKGSGPNFRNLGTDVNPILWAQKMWNHAPPMYQRMRAQGLPWPTFDGNEMVDLIAYASSIAEKPERALLEPGDEKRGLRAFQERGCARCHSDNPKSGAPSLSTLARNPKTVGQMAGLMWNHAPAMVEHTKSSGMQWTSISAQEMADLTTYFFTLRFAQAKGDSALGEKVFVKKSCSLCHSGGGGGRDFKRDKKGISAIQMTQFMWTHGPEMLKKMEEKRIAWPRFEGYEMVDLLAYMNDGAPKPAKK